MSQLTIDSQVVTQTCGCCGTEFNVSRGGVYREGQPLGIYLAAMHGCQDKLVFLAIAIQQELDESRGTSCVTLQAWPTDTEIQMRITDPDESPWENESYLGPILSRDAALASPIITTFYEIADQITTRAPVYEYLVS